MFEGLKSGPAHTLFTHNCSDCGIEMTSEEWHNSHYNIYYRCFGVHLCEDCIKRRGEKISDNR